MVQPAEHRFRADLGPRLAIRSWSSRTGSTLPDGPVWTPMIEIADILTQDPAQLALIEDEHVVQTLGSGRSLSLP